MVAKLPYPQHLKALLEGRFPLVKRSRIRGALFWRISYIFLEENGGFLECRADGKAKDMIILVLMEA